MADYFDYKECLSAEEREFRQTLQIIEMLKAGYQKSGRIRKIFAELKLDHSEIKTLSDFEKLPYISRGKLIEL